MAGASSRDLAFCRARCLGPHSPLSISLRFATPELQEPLLILHTLTGEIRAIPFEVSQPEPALAKLAWWQSELDEARGHDSTHPVIRAARESGLLGMIDKTDLFELINGVAATCMGNAVPDQQALMDHARNIGGVAASIEQKLESRVPDGQTPVVGMIDFLCNCLGNFDRRLAGESWWLPLDVQAKFGLSWKPLSNRHFPRSYRHAMKSQAKDILENIGNELMPPHDDALIESLGRHLFVYTSLNLKRIGDLSVNPARRWPMRNRPADSILAWRKAVRHRRLASKSGGPQTGTGDG